jgi:hypothetical protein
MASLTDLFNPTFLMFLGILVLVVALLVIYFETKFRDQNHKISSMLSLVSSLAEEVNGTKMIIHQLAMNPQMQQQAQFFQNNNSTLERTNLQNKNDLIDVSDDEESDSDSDSDSDDEDSVSDDAASVDEDSDSDEKPNSDIKVFRLNISEDLNQIDEDSKSLAESLDEESLDEASLDEASLDEASLEDLDDSSSESIQETDVKKIDNFMDLKSINITLEETKTEQYVDYKKMGLPKLRSVVVEKGLSSDSSKLKKNELLKLLGIE